MNRRRFLAKGLSFTPVLISPACGEKTDQATSAPPFDFSTSRGMNMIDLCGPAWYPPEKFLENEFKLLADQGFNHVRLLVDSFYFTSKDQPHKFDTVRAEKIDHGIALARKHGLHATLAFFAVPGFSVHQQNQSPSLWDDPGLQKTFASFWEIFAKRYREIPPAELSFNLLNESPWNLSAEKYTALMRLALDAIRATSKDRPVIIDGLKAGREPLKSFLSEPHLIQSAHFYEPFELTHYQADWLSDSARYPTAKVWPLPRIPHHLFGRKQEHHSPLTLKGDFSSCSELTLHLGEVLLSEKRPLTLSLTGIETSSIALTPQASWKKENEIPEHDLIQYWADTIVTLPVPKNDGTLNLRVTTGDRLNFRNLTLGNHCLMPSSREWCPQPSPLNFSPSEGFKTVNFYDKNWIKSELARTWKPCLEVGQPVVVQEFGCNHLLPHDTAISYLRDCRAAFEELNLGWTYYSNTGTLGVLRSPRKNGSLDPALLKVLSK